MYNYHSLTVTHACSQPGPQLAALKLKAVEIPRYSKIYTVPTILLLAIAPIKLHYRTFPVSRICLLVTELTTIELRPIAKVSSLYGSFTSPYHLPYSILQ